MVLGPLARLLTAARAVAAVRQREADLKAHGEELRTLSSLSQTLLATTDAEAILDSELRHAHVEQKNWTVVRQVIGYARYESSAARDLLQSIYQNLRLFVNFFEPVMKLPSKSRVGSKVSQDLSQRGPPQPEPPGPESTPAAPSAAAQVDLPRLT